MRRYVLTGDGVVATRRRKHARPGRHSLHDRVRPPSRVIHTTEYAESGSVLALLSSVPVDACAISRSDHALESIREADPRLETGLA